MPIDTTNFLLIVAAALTSIVGNSLFRLGLQKTGILSLNPLYLIKNAFPVLSQPLVLAGAAVFIIGMFIWMRVLSIMPLSKSYPVFIGFVVLFVVVSSMFFLREPLSIARIAGMILIVSGAFLVFAK